VPSTTLFISVVFVILVKMPGEVIDRPNPKPLPSNVPAVVDELMVKVEQSSLTEEAYDALHKFRRAANYIAAGETFRHLSSSAEF
jgi:hypothetical protein